MRINVRRARQPPSVNLRRIRARFGRRAGGRKDGLAAARGSDACI
ncbi:hypothetical protein [Christensenella minuta]|nr:hypothetical protein [Christensenella minuta]